MPSRPECRVRVRRVYDPPEPDDGVRVLVDRLWPRGLSKERAAVDEWPKDLTPSKELRTAYHAGQWDFAEFRSRYEAELAEPAAAEALDRLRETAAAGTVTLVTAVKDPEHSHVTVLVGELSKPR
ncbi:hypothetical protein GCM10010329_51390 [Streptomyces spiroverticillatus]|uniref:DUF488 family protein n=1 Tax=Streptomyces finlayi TaxID=67296 RepID=A0A918X1P7_9ACTN|nr:DUF488 family protein [Streptomyces finlayi]GHA21820.1 hypothetical protein GCM10010329_51390 [Streptomyces spiroverticillatus]GHD04033.1 hypothetical protein GCM10010334_52330 [Streptomyces finlayi]